MQLVADVHELFSKDIMQCEVDQALKSIGDTRNHCLTFCLLSARPEVVFRAPFKHELPLRAVISSVLAAAALHRLDHASELY